MAISLKVNGVPRSVPAEPDTPLLYVLRNDLELNGAKYGCGLSQCGACTVLIDGKAVRSCVTPISALGEERDHHHRRPRHDRQAASAAAGLHRRAGGAVRLLHQRHDHVGEGTARPQSAAERAGRARGARRQSLPLRHPQPHHSRGAARRPGEREDLTMNAPDLTRRALHRRPRRARRRLLARSECSPSAQEPQRLPGSLQNNRKLDGWIRINRRRHRDRLHRQGRARAGHPHRARADRGRGARSAARARQDDLRRYRPDAERRPDRRQPIGREQRHRACAWPAPRCARSCSISRPSGSAWPPDQLTVADGVITAPDGRKISYGELAVGPISIAKRPPRRRRSRRRATRSSANPLRASTSRPRSPAARPSCRTCGLPGMLHGRVVRPPRYGSKLDSVDEARGQGDARRGRGGARRLLPRRRRRARGTGDQGARSACARARNGHWDPSCPIPRASSR